MLRILPILLSSILLLCSSVLEAADPSVEYQKEDIRLHRFAKEQWQELSADMDFTEAKEKIRSPEEKKPENLNRKPINTQFWATVFKILVLVAGIGLVAILLAHFLGGANLFVPRSRKIAPAPVAISIESIEENIHESDLEAHLQDAVARQDFSLAIRLYYLAIIKELSLSKQINWKKDKTNYDYLREMRGQDLYREFWAVTRIFERTWYGRSGLTQLDYQRLQPRFAQLLSATKAQTTV